MAQMQHIAAVHWMTRRELCIIHTVHVHRKSPNTSPNAFAVLECFHIAGFALAIGMIALVDFRLLGFGLLKQSPAQIARAFEWWTLGGLIGRHCFPDC